MRNFKLNFPLKPLGFFYRGKKFFKQILIVPKFLETQTANFNEKNSNKTYRTGERV